MAMVPFLPYEQSNYQHNAVKVQTYVHMYTQSQGSAKQVHRKTAIVHMYMYICT